MLIDLCLGHLPLEPWPILLITALGLTTASRAWRAITLAVLAAALPALLYLAHHLKQMGWHGSSLHLILNRVWPVPHIALAATLLLAALLTLPAIALLTHRWIRES